MLDVVATRWIAPAVQSAARWLHDRGATANALTFTAFALGLIAAGLIAAHWYLSALVFMLASRSCDALDGAVARLTQPTDRGGYFDIALDMAYYALIVLAFAVADPAANALPAAVLLAAFMGTSSSLLAYAVMMEKCGTSEPKLRPNVTAKRDGDVGKSFVFASGLAEATETLIVFAAMCVWPHWFGALAYVFAVLCAVTVGQRWWTAWVDLEKKHE
jgi:phosphatidylglycerophosphate synthase